MDVKISIRKSREAWQVKKIAVKKIPAFVSLSGSAPQVNGVYSHPPSPSFEEIHSVDFV